MDPVIFFDPAFVWNVIGGWLLVLAGVGLLFVAGLWWALQSDASQASPRSPAWRALCVAGWGAFIAGMVWQFVGYGLVGILAW
jgi:hypothetical protein